ncbi:D-aminoacyl-tRNA deacylase 1 [Orussus abietinus]|uniref:D-aminoacyl-tRNA deacylase 1 n=1 Tax=Orussus abietinus TaxID=222816 RepID=UPI00062568B7|nr:D-aminoacyl-tRNA deacylase 1 [Orussus abietinus]
MKALVQRVTAASVLVNNEVISTIGKGLCVFIGISREDTLEDIRYIVRKILNVKFFDDEKDKKWSNSVMDKQYEILCVSQFTLYHVLKGNKIDFHKAMAGEKANLLFSHIVDELRAKYKPEFVKDGLFGAMMQVKIENDGPVTIEIETPKKDTSNNAESI